MDVAQLTDLIEARHDAVQRPVVVGISGYGGAGKSTLARALVEQVRGSVRMRGDDFLDPTRSHRRSCDWDGVERDRLASEVLEPFRDEHASTFRRFDWGTRRLGPAETVPSGDVLIVDLIGLFHPDVNDVMDLRIWVDVDLETATRRGIARDRELGRRHEYLWHEVWVPNERDFVARFDPRAASHVCYPA